MDARACPYEEGKGSCKAKGKGNDKGKGKGNDKGKGKGNDKGKDRDFCYKCKQYNYQGKGVCLTSWCPRNQPNQEDDEAVGWLVEFFTKAQLKKALQIKRQEEATSSAT